VVAVDRPSDVHRFAPDLLLNFAVHYRGTRGTNRLFDVLAHACPDAGSPTETRLRVVIVRAGLE
jgi:hypothetical protein